MVQRIFNFYLVVSHVQFMEDQYLWVMNTPTYVNTAGKVVVWFRTKMPWTTPSRKNKSSSPSAILHPALSTIERSHQRLVRSEISYFICFSLHNSTYFSITHFFCFSLVLTPVFFLVSSCTSVFLFVSHSFFVLHRQCWLSWGLYQS